MIGLSSISLCGIKDVSKGGPPILIGGGGVGKGLGICGKGCGICGITGGGAIGIEGKTFEVTLPKPLT